MRGEKESVWGGGCLKSLCEVERLAGRWPPLGSDLKHLSIIKHNNNIIIYVTSLFPPLITNKIL